MPAIQREHVQLAVLLLCVPFQYFIIQYMESSEVSRTYAISKMMDEIKDFHGKWLKLAPWKTWCQQLLVSVISEKGQFHDQSENVADDDLGESPAVEVLEFTEKHGYFGQSSSVRDPKPPQVKYRVGQVVMHRRFRYKGVIVAWDETTRAPESWIKAWHGENHHYRDQPNYGILVDTRDRTAPQMTYVPQENIEVIGKTKIFHPSIDEYFETFDGSQYLPRPWLKARYPRD